MQPEEARRLAPSGRGFLLLAVVGGAVGSVLILLDGPFWLFYLAPVAMMPIVLRELRALGKAQSLVRESELVERDPARSSRTIAQEVAGAAASISGVQTKGAVQRFAVSEELLFRMRKEDAVLVDRSAWRHYVKSVRELEEPSHNWIAAGWGLTGMAVSLGAVAAVAADQRLLLGASTLFCVAAAIGCFVIERQLRRGYAAVAERLAREMENTDAVEVVPLEVNPPADT